MKKRNSPRSAFTLIELAAVVAILGIAVTIFVAKVDNVTPGTRLRASARLVGGAFELAMSDAVMKGFGRSVVYDQRAGTVAVKIDTAMPRSIEEMDRKTLFERRLPYGVEMTDVEGVRTEEDRSVVVVSPSGRAAPHSVHLRNSAGEMTVEIYGVTGRIRYHDGKVLMREFVRESAASGN